MAVTIDIRQGVAGNPEQRLAVPLDFTLRQGEQLAIVGENASGKTRLAQTVAGILPLSGDCARYDFSPSPLTLTGDNIRFISFKDSYGDADQGYYLQKRWNRQDIDEEDTPTTAMLLDTAFRTAESSARMRLPAGICDALSLKRQAMLDKLLDLFALRPLMDRFIISLSSGELRKFQLTKALLALPRVLVIDNPFIGLDPEGRKVLSDLLGDLIRETGISVIVLLARTDMIPSFITRVIRMDALRPEPGIPADRFIPDDPHPVLPARKKKIILDIPCKDLGSVPFYPKAPDAEIIRCEKVGIRYGDKQILKDFDWTVREGERWALCGANGSGKSTLLSLVCADNPQGYACRISLFGHRRGSGESIWEIKRHIGYVSPEMHRAWRQDQSALDIVASGLFDTVGLFNRPTEEQTRSCLLWMDIFGIKDLADKSYLRLSSGQQRLCLLARAFVKDPELLILDEPLHGLDWRRSRLAMQIIDCFMERPHKTLVMVSHYKEEFPACINRTLTLTPQK